MVDQSRRLHLLVEGQTEETVVRQTLEPYLRSRGFWCTTSILVTRRPAGQAWNRGGVGTWAQIRGDVDRLLRDSSLDVLTTMIDYYGFPADGPGMDSRPPGSADERVRHVEKALTDLVPDPRFIPHLVLHETEAWVYAAAAELAELTGDTRLEAVLHAEAAAAGGPEAVDDGPTTAPSKRLARHCPDYVKTLHGPLTIEACGIDAIRVKCPHMDDWLSALGL